MGGSWSSIWNGFVNPFASDPFVALMKGQDPWNAALNQIGINGQNSDADNVKNTLLSLGTIPQPQDKQQNVSFTPEVATPDYTIRNPDGTPKVYSSSTSTASSSTAANAARMAALTPQSSTVLTNNPASNSAPAASVTPSGVSTEWSDQYSAFVRASADSRTSDWTS